MGVGLAVVSLLIALMQGVFCKTWDVTLPQSIVDLRGTCGTFPCYSTVNNKPERVVLNCLDSGAQTGEETPVFITRSALVPPVKNVTRRECTTTSHSIGRELNIFNLDCSENLRFTFNGITVEAGVPLPRLTSVSQVSEGAQVRLQCSVPMPCPVLPPSITWLHLDDSSQEQTQVEQPNMEGQMIMTSTLTFTASAHHHDQSITCAVSFPLTGGGSTELLAETQTLHVLYAPTVPMATLWSVPAADGHLVTLTCLSDANPPVSRYTWFRSDAGGLTKAGEGELLILEVGQQDSGVYLCEAQSQRGSKRSKPVSLQLSADNRGSGSVIPYVLCGLMLLLYILAVVVCVYKYQGLSRRLKRIERKGEHTYTDLAACRAASDYDQLQPQQPKTMMPPAGHNYENLQKQP